MTGSAMAAIRASMVGCIAISLALAAEAGVVEIKVDLEMNGSDCVASMDAARKVSKRKRDVLVWNVTNACPAPQPLRVCLSGGKPLRKCNGEPGDAGIGRKFTVEAGAVGAPAFATVTCHVKWDVLDNRPPGRKKYLVEVLSGAKAHPRCVERPVCPGPVCPESELSLEVEP